MTALVRAGLVTALSIVASFVLAAIIIPWMGGAFDRTALVMCTVCPALIAFPVSYRTYRHRVKLVELNERLAAAHEELADAHRRLAERTRRDEMTGLLNRETFFREIALTRAACRVGHLLIVDADHFKTVNDSHGHLAGDSALQLMADAIETALRPGDLAARIGGEEFAAYLPDADGAEARQVAERVRKAVADLDFVSDAGERVALTVSIGAARDMAGLALVDVIRAADRRLYEAKRAGRNMAVFYGLSRAA